MTATEHSPTPSPPDHGSTWFVVLVALAACTLLMLVPDFSARLAESTTRWSEPDRTACFLATAFFYALLPRRWGETAAVFLVGLSWEWWIFTHLPSDPTWTLWVKSQHVGLGFSAVGLVGCVARFATSEGDEQAFAFRWLMFGLMMWVFPSVSLWAHHVVARNTPLVIDSVGYGVDRLWGDLPSNIVGRFCWGHPFVHSLVCTVYAELALLLSIAAFLCHTWSNRCYYRVLHVFIGMGALVMLLYPIVPMAGLVFQVGNGFWDTPPHDIALAWVSAPTDWVRNCMPSMHMAWILCIYFAVRRIHPVVHAFAFFFLGVTTAATLYVGHYLVDLVASFPYVLAFLALTARRTPRNTRIRWIAGCTGTVLLAAWLLGLRYLGSFLIGHPVFTMGVQVAIVLISVILESRLASASLPAADETHEDSCPPSILPHEAQVMVARPDPEAAPTVTASH